MKKIFTLLTVFTILSYMVNAQLPVSQTPGPKNALIEEFTGIHCVYCPDGHKIAKQITDANPNRAFAVNIHTGSFATPSGGEPDFRTPDGDAIRVIPQMNVTGYPMGAINRKLYGTSTYYAMSRGVWTAAVNAILAQPAYVNVAGQATLDVNTRALTVNIEAFYTSASPAATNKLTVMLLQNNINGPQTGGATYNPTMMNPDGTYRHMHALRDVITVGATGEDISPTTQGTLIQKTVNYTIPTSYVNVPAELGNMEVLAFVAEGVPNIINVCRVPISFTGLSTTNNAAVTAVASIDPTCINPISPKFTLKNMGGAALTSAVVSYSINGGTPQTYNWSGSLAPLTSAEVTLPPYTYILNTSNTLNINVTSVNGTNDDDPADNTGTTNFSKTTSTSPTLNLTLNVVQDRYGSEITWKFFNAAGTQIAAGGPYTDLAANGTAPHSHNITLPSWGCYRFVIYDSYGDGINAGYGAGSVTILDGNGGTVWYNNGQYTNQASRNFDAAFVGIEETALVNGISIFPNPVSSKSTVDFNLTENNEVTVKVVDQIGQTVMVETLGKLQAGNQTYVLDATSLSSGLYFVELHVGNGVVTRKISVSK